MKDTTDFYNSAWNEWEQMIDTSPAPRHRRRIIINIIRKIAESGKIKSIADIGCGNGILIKAISDFLNSKETAYYGYDISETIINKNRAVYPNFYWETLNLDKEFTASKTDVVICSEVIEHTQDWRKSLVSVINGAEKHAIITVPSGFLFTIDKLCGHTIHFNKSMIKEALDKIPGITYEIFFWGFPFHSLYKNMINVSPEKTYRSFMKKKYGFFEKIISIVLYLLFFLNLKSNFETSQMFIIIDKTGKK